jgi:hypothetical protein
LTFFVHVYPLKSYSTFFIWLENPLWGEILAFFGDLNPLAKFGELAFTKGD